MTAIKNDQKNYLEERFGSRVTFDPAERKIYSHDIGEMPRLIKPLIGDTRPDCVVQPETEQELAELVEWAVANRIPLTPRGKATSGYGGVLPIKGGIVVDFYRMNRLLSVDGEIVTVQAGAVWERLEKELMKNGLMLRLYPTSYMASTVGGWLAQGGAGIGSFQAGWFRDNVLSARVVQPDGNVRVFENEELDLISDAGGITGLISEVTFRAQPLEELETIAVAGKQAQNAQELMERLIAEKLPVWSIIFINPKMAAMKNRTPLREHLGHPAEERVILPEAYITVLTFRKTDRDAVMNALPFILEDTGSEMLSREIADHEWENRFKVMLIKRLGPSLVPAEIVFPLSSMSAVMRELEKKITQPIVKEGIIIRDGRDGEPEVVILGFIPSDQRKFRYHLIFSLSLSILKIAQKHGGRAYTTGLYFAHEAPEVLGDGRIGRLKEYKRKLDPLGLMNPGKVIETGLVSRLIGMAGAFEGITRYLGNRARTEIAEAVDKPVRGIPADVAWHAYSCSQCGYCVDECDQFYGRGWESHSPRGKWYWLREYMEGREQWSQRMVDTILSCTTCEMCNLRCSESLPIEPSWLKLRGALIEDQKKMTFPPLEMMSLALQKEGNIWAGYRKNRTDWFPEDLWEKHGPGHQSKMVYFAGCTASYVEQDIAIATVKLLDAANVDFSYVGSQENCCGTPMLVAGKWEIFAATMEKNIQRVKETGADTVVCSCPACDMMWRSVYPVWARKRNINYDIKALHYSEVVADKIKSGEFSFPKNGNKPVKVTWHDSCHMGRVSGVYEPPRELIKAIPEVDFVEMEHNRDQGHCCGSVLTLMKDPPVAAEIGKMHLDEAVDVGAEKVLALCPCCEFQLRVSADKKKVPVEVVDLARFAAGALGHELPDPNPEVRKQWAVFEKMIALMTPRGFADLMATMWPELIDAMPLGMGRMMRIMGRIPGALTLMKPLFPVLFPILLPKMMPKVMPVMLERVAERIPMPDYMKEQMPVLMPGVMDSLMPHMLGDVVPLVTQPMIDYLRGKTGSVPEEVSEEMLLSEEVPLNVSEEAAKEISGVRAGASD